MLPNMTWNGVFIVHDVVFDNITNSILCNPVLSSHLAIDNPEGINSLI